jgi:hypothetical protein
VSYIAARYVLVYVGYGYDANLSLRESLCGGHEYTMWGLGDLGRGYINTVE